MEYCENQTLRQLIDSGELVPSPDRVWRLFREVVEGLEHIHSKVGPIPMSPYLHVLILPFSFNLWQYHFNSL